MVFGTQQAAAHVTVALRAHHLLAHNFDGIVRRLAAGEEALLVDGPDAICAPLCETEGACAHCYSADVLQRDQRAARELALLLGRPLGPGSRLRLDVGLLSRMRTAFVSGQIRGACAGCEWAGLCTGIASSGYQGVRLRMQAAAKSSIAPQPVQPGEKSKMAV